MAIWCEFGNSKYIIQFRVELYYWIYYINDSWTYNLYYNYNRARNGATVRNLAIRTLNEYTEAVLSQISVKQETGGADGVYFFSGREKSGFCHVDFEICPNQILK